MLGDQANMSVVFPLNTFNFGGYVMHEVYNTRNLFFSPADGGDGRHEIVNAGAKFRDGFFQYDNAAFYAQDDFHPIPRIHIIPGVRVNGFTTSYSNQAYKDFTMAPGVIPSTHCALFPSASDPFHNVFGSPSVGSSGDTTKDQGSLCGSHASKSAIEPSIDASFTPFDWITIYVSLIAPISFEKQSFNLKLDTINIANTPGTETGCHTPAAASNSAVLGSAAGHPLARGAKAG
jgi:iron complex outermembrane receptor protein